MIEDNNYVVQGMSPMLDEIPEVLIGKMIYDNLSANVNDNKALIDALTGRSVTYRDILGKTCSLAQALRNAGYNENDIFAISSENCVEFFIPILATLYLGAPMAPINHGYTIHEMSHALNISQPNIVFCSKETSEKFIQLKKTLNFIKNIIVIDSEENFNGLQCLDAFIASHLNTKELVYEFQIKELDTNQVAFILYSSGTTGLPKGVMITHKNVLTKFIHGADSRFIGEPTGQSNIGVLPFYHAYGLFVGLGSIYKQIQVLVIKKFDEHLYLKTIQNYKITTLLLVPPLAVFLARTPLLKKYDLSSVREVGCGAAPLSKQTEELLQKRFKIRAMRQGYGLTETTLGTIGNIIGEEKLGSVGKLMPYITCKVRDPETGKSLGPNQTGELCFKGPVIMKGYYNNEEATRNAFTSDGWLLTGDTGYYDTEENFYIVGRLKELIKYKGFQVAPAELEAILLTNPKIYDAAVIGVPNEEAGELPLAFVVKNPNVNLTAEEVKQFIAEKVSSPKRLRGGVIFVEEIPKNPSGKILRRKLHELLKTYVKSKL